MLRSRMDAHGFWRKLVHCLQGLGSFGRLSGRNTRPSSRRQPKQQGLDTPPALCLDSRSNMGHASQAAEEPRPGQPGYNPMRAAMAAGGGGMHGGGAGEGLQPGEHHHGQDGNLMLGHHGAPTRHAWWSTP